MAGIGFDLRRLVDEDSGLLDRLRAYAGAGVITSGAWIVTMLSLWLARAAAASLGQDALDGFVAVVGAVFAASLVTVSGLQMAITRHLADALFQRGYSRLLPAFATATVLVAGAQAATGAVACWLLDFGPALSLAAVLLYVAVSIAWLAMAWLTVIRQHDKVLGVYLLGGGSFLLGLRLLGAGAGLADVVMVYAASWGLIVVLMSVAIARGVEAAERRSGDVLAGLWRHRVLWLAGTVYGLSLWVDKWLFWWLDGVDAVGGLRQHPLYDACFYLGYLTVVPAMSVNLVHLETAFYERYRAYFAAVTGNAPLARIRALGGEMAVSLRAGAGGLLRIQGAVTLACVALAGPIVRSMGLPDYAARVFRLVCIGAFCHVLLLITVLVLLYFDRCRAALRACAVFLAANALLAWASVVGGPATYGAGFALAALAGLLVALVELRGTFLRLEYLTFVRE